MTQIEKHQIDETTDENGKHIIKLFQSGYDKILSLQEVS